MIAHRALNIFLVAGTALFSLLLAAHAATSAQSSQETQQQRMDCADDARIVCGRFIPDVALITRCMEANVRQLSPQCRRHFQ